MWTVGWIGIHDLTTASKMSKNLPFPVPAATPTAPTRNVVADDDDEDDDDLDEDEEMEDDDDDQSD